MLSVRRMVCLPELQDRAESNEVVTEEIVHGLMHQLYASILVPDTFDIHMYRRRLEAKEIPSNAICPIVIKKWKGEIPDDCYYNLSGDR